MLGAVVGLYVKARIRSANAINSGPATETGGSPDSPMEDSAAWHYARAYQEGDWNTVLRMTLWAQERLQLIRSSGTAEDVSKEEDALLASFGTRTMVENRLLDTGVDDQYIFTPTAALVFDTVDEGRQDLEMPVARRTWMTVTYPARERALLDSESLPIRSVRVGVNVSHDGYVLKANIIGNLDIDWTSIRYDWPSR